MPEEVSRRRFVGLLGAGAGIALAGCSTAPAAESNTQRTLETPNATGAPSRFTKVYREVRNSAVQVRVVSEDGVSQGSGWVYDDEGHLVTNEHVVSGAQEVYVRFRTTGWRPVSNVGTDVYSDLAVIGADDVPEKSHPLPVKEEDPPIGEEVLAIGNPFGFSGSVTSGIVSGLNRTLPATSGSNFTIPDAIQTDAPVNPGNSGGPLVDLEGNVVGVINSGGGDNIGFAISGALVSRVVPSLIETGDYDHPYMGIYLQSVTPAIAAANDLDVASGVYVAGVVDGGPADGVLQGGTTNAEGVPVGGDIIKRMGGQQIPTTQALSSFLALKTSPGETIDIEIIRDGQRQTVELTLGQRPEPPQN